MIRRILALVKKEFLHLKNDWWLPAFMLFGGALELLMVGWATSRPISNLPMMIWDQDKTAASRNLVIQLENTDVFTLTAPVESMAPIEDQMNRGNINAAVIIPQGFSEELISTAGQPVLQVILNGAESIPAKEAQRAIEGVIRDLGEKITIKKLHLDPNQFSGFDFSLRVWFNEELSEAYFTTPAELGLMLEFTILIFAALTFSREREFGTLEQLLVMPFSSLEIIIGKSIPVILVGMADFAMMLGVVHFAFHVPIRGSMVLLFTLAFGYTLVELGKGMAISVFSKSQHQAFLIVLMIGMIDFMFTGYAAPVESMPLIIRFLANIIPAHHWLDILRGILLKGSGFFDILPSVIALLILGIIIITVSLRFIRRTLD
ncbi:MAG: ABC transporter permease [Anaerolineales bacterium]|nr:ABC transporter permease [Anaerolineales bacterium]